MAPARSRLQRWLERRDRSNQIAMDALRPPPPPRVPAVVLHALTSVPDPAFAYPLRVVIDGKSIDSVPWGWSVHPLALGEHTLELFHRSGVFPRASRAFVHLTLDPAQPVLHVVYKAGAIGIRRGRVSVEGFNDPGVAKPAEHGEASPN